MNTPVLYRICIDRTAPKPVSPVIYGWHYEEIGMIGDGGLYAEMIRNRNFSETSCGQAELSAGISAGAGWVERIGRERFHRSDYSE